MNSMVEEAEPLSLEELKTRLEAIAEKDPVLVALFVGRCAQRVMPFLAIEGTFSFWRDSEQARHLLAVWFAATLGFAQSNNLTSVSIDAADLAFSRASAALAAEAAANAFDATTDLATSEFGTDLASDLPVQPSMAPSQPASRPVLPTLAGSSSLT